MVWKFDVAVEAIRDALKQAAIEEGHWIEKRDTGAGGARRLADLKARINRGRDRMAAKKESLARGGKW